MKTTCSVDDAGTGLSLLHLAGFVRYKVIKTARKDSIEAQKAVDIFNEDMTIFICAKKKWKQRILFI